jgi:hypothetical protein
MQFAILGDHPDGWSVARALAGGRHRLIAYFGDGLPGDFADVRVTADLEDVLADPQIDAVIVAGLPGERLDQLRRVLQSERSALCVHPVDRTPDGAYEMNMLQGDTHQVALPILPLAVNRTLAKLAESIKSLNTRLIEVEFRNVDELLFEGADGTPHFPGWEVVRRLGGTVAEVQAFAAEESVHRGELVTVQGRYEGGALFRIAYLPGQHESRLRIAATGASGSSSLDAVTVTADDWAAVVAGFESATERLRVMPRAAPGAGPALAAADGLSWRDEVRAAELDDAARRSIERRRGVTLDYQEASEEVGFKGTMTLIGCGLLWFIPVLLLMSVWFPYIGWLIVPVLFGFLLLQLLRWFVPAPTPPEQ